MKARMTVTAVLAACAVEIAVAQPAGVCPLGATDVVTAQLVGKVSSVECTTWHVDFSRHTIVKDGQASHTIDRYMEDGRIESSVSMDADGLVDTKTIYQYDDEGRKRVSTTYSAAGDRTLQTLYAYTADGCLARMRFTDADAVTISTTEVGTATGWSQTAELFNDGEKVVTTYTYDDRTRLSARTSDDGHMSSTLRLTMGLDGLPSRGSYSTSDGRKQTITFEHEKDVQGNWTRRVTYIDGKATELSVRKITYY